jgi:hypothetical protein
MATTVTLSYLQPPPTSNHLDLSQKSRLMKSTRKLGQVLGTTPFLLETPAELPVTLLPIAPRTSSPTPSTSSTSSAESIRSIKRFRRQGSIFQRSPIVHSASSSASSLSLPGNMSSSSVDLLSAHSMPLSRRSKDTHRPPPLVLHLNPVMVSPDDHRIGEAQLSTFPTPLALDVDDFPLSPTTPKSNAFFHQKKEADAKRRKLNKINRTFGESVPTELIFPNTTNHTSRSATVTRTAGA